MIELAPPREDPLPRWLVPAALGAWVLMLLVPATQILRDTPIYGDDHSSHLAVVRHLIALLRAGSSDFFCPTFNLGFPMYLYYQPLPHLTAAGLHLLSFGVAQYMIAFDLAWPITPSDRSYEVRQADGTIEQASRPPFKLVFGITQTY